MSVARVVIMVRSLFLTLNIFMCMHQTAALNIAKDGNTISRRHFALHIPASSAAAAAVLLGGTTVSPQHANAVNISPISSRLDSDLLTSPPITAGTKYTGHENLYFPSWMEGEWDATQTLLSTKAPIGELTPFL